MIGNCSQKHQLPAKRLKHREKPPTPSRAVHLISSKHCLGNVILNRDMTEIRNVMGLLMKTGFKISTRVVRGSALEVYRFPGCIRFARAV
jgi:hypothetical protein